VLRRAGECDVPDPREVECAVEIDPLGVEGINDGMDCEEVAPDAVMAFSAYQTGSHPHIQKLQHLPPRVLTPPPPPSLPQAFTTKHLIR
jgi:hypothetical protein